MSEAQSVFSVFNWKMTEMIDYQNSFLVRATGIKFKPISGQCSQHFLVHVKCITQWKWIGSLFWRHISPDAYRPVCVHTREGNILVVTYRKDNGLWCCPQKYGGLRHLLGQNTEEENVTVLPLFLLWVYRLGFQVKARVSDMQHLPRKVHRDPAGGHNDGDAQLATPARLWALRIYHDTVQFSSRDTRGEAGSFNGS